MTRIFESERFVIEACKTPNGTYMVTYQRRADGMGMEFLSDCYSEKPLWHWYGL